MLLIADADVATSISLVFFATAGYQLLQRATDLNIGSAGTHRWWAWLVAHLIAFALFFALGPGVLNATPLNPSAVLSWLILGIVSTAFMAFCFFSPLTLFRFVYQQWRLLLLSTAAALAAWLLGKALQQLWQPLAEGTFRITYYLLHSTPLAIQYSPNDAVIGTERFLVQIAPECSGYEGIALVIVFVSLYIYIFKNTIRFPAVLVLYPIGIIVMYLANSLRLVGLILIGHFSSAEDAVKGFHSQAGWTMFTLLSLALLLVSRTVPGLSTIQHEPDENLAAHQLASALLVPFLVLLGSGLLTSTVFGEIRSADAIVVVATAAALWRYRAAYRTLTWSWTWWSVAIGVGVFAIWMTLVRADPGDGHQAAVSLEMSDGLAVGWIVLRLIRSVLIVPVVEELAFRGYLLRKLASAHFDRVPMGEFTWLSLFASTILFGLLHQHWLAGTIAGFAYAIAQRQCRSIGGAVIAHGVTNGLIAAVMVVDGQWGLRP